LRDASLRHEQLELSRQRACYTLCQTRKQKRIVTLSGWQGEQIFLKHWMNHSDDLFACLARHKPNRLDLRNEIDVAPAQIRAVAQASADIERGEDQTAPIACCTFHQRTDLLRRECRSALRFVAELLKRRTRIHADMALLERGVER